AAQAPQEEQQVQFKANQLEGTIIDDERCQKLTGDVHFVLEDMTIQADSAIYYEKRKLIEAQGKVKIVHKDGAVFWADHLLYNEETQLAQLRGQVVYQSDEHTFYTDNFDYNVDTQKGHFWGGIKFVEGDNTITSQSGYCDANHKSVTFHKDVALINKDYQLQCDTLYYNTVTKIARFRGHTIVTSKDGKSTLTTEEGGEYNTSSQQGTLKQSAIETQDYLLYADLIQADAEQENYTAMGNVGLVAKEDDLVIYGDYGAYQKKAGIAQVYGNTLLEKILEDDTLYVSADTLVAIENQETKDSKDAVVRAYHHVKIYKQDLQGKADTMVYQGTDSTIHFEGEPVFWNYGNQLTADKAHILLKDKAFHEMHMNTNAFIISQEDLGYFSQLKGRDMVAYFQNNKIDSITIDGNAESLYFVVDQAQLKGMNHLRCGQMYITLQDDEIAKIVFQPQPQGTFFPPHLIKEEDKKLSNFNWRAHERPTRREVIEHGYGTNQDYQPFKFGD
ncbi:MAG: OstA-like protein, partial [Bacteroidota bacterium]